MLISTEFCVVKTIRNTRSIEGAIVCFNVNRNFMLSDFVLTGFYCTYVYGETSDSGLSQIRTQ